jgi:hypothetical protein
MRTSLNNIKAIDDYLLNGMAPGDLLLFEANMILNDELVNDVAHQQSAYAMIRQYSRQRIKEEIMAVQETLTTAPQHVVFMQRIASMFKKQ